MVPVSGDSIDWVWLGALARLLLQHKGKFIIINRIKVGKQIFTNILDLMCQRRLPGMSKHIHRSRNSEWCHQPWPDDTEEQPKPYTGSREMQHLREIKTC